MRSLNQILKPESYRQSQLRFFDMLVNVVMWMLHLSSSEQSQPIVRSGSELDLNPINLDCSVRTEEFHPDKAVMIRGFKDFDNWKSQRPCTTQYKSVLHFLPIYYRTGVPYKTITWYVIHQTYSLVFPTKSPRVFLLCAGEKWPACLYSMDIVNGFLVLACTTVYAQQSYYV